MGKYELYSVFTFFCLSSWCVIRGNEWCHGRSDRQYRGARFFIESNVIAYTVYGLIEFSCYNYCKWKHFKALCNSLGCWCLKNLERPQTNHYLQLQSNKKNSTIKYCWIIVFFSLLKIMLSFCFMQLDQTLCVNFNNSD